MIWRQNRSCESTEVAEAGDIPIARVTDFPYVVNMRVARELARFPLFAFMQIAETTK